MRTINLPIGSYKVKYFFDSDIYNGINVFNSIGTRIGSMYGEVLPDFTDEYSLCIFKNDLENWIIDNEQL